MIKCFQRRKIKARDEEVRGRGREGERRKERRKEGREGGRQCQGQF